MIIFSLTKMAKFELLASDDFDDDGVDVDDDDDVEGVELFRALIQ